MSVRVRIFQPSKNAMQSGRAKSAIWTIEPELVTARTPEPLMGWSSSGDTLGELKYKLNFQTLDEAIAFAQKEGWEYSVSTSQPRRVQPRNYLDNFKWIRPQDEARADNQNDAKSEKN